jgi:D-alanyl-D-alanine carboxypeptidase
MKKILLLCIGLILINCTYDPPTKPSDWYTNPVSYTDDSSTHPRRQLFQAYLDSAVAEGLPGAVLLIRTPQEGTWVGVSGYADITSRVPWQPATLSRVGSITKTFAAIVILQLYGDSRLELDDLARPYLPKEVVSNVANAGTCTIRQLLNHSSGIYNYLESISSFQMLIAAIVILINQRKN